MQSAAHLGALAALGSIRCAARPARVAAGSDAADAVHALQVVALGALAALGAVRCAARPVEVAAGGAGSWRGRGGGGGGRGCGRGGCGRSGGATGVASVHNGRLWCGRCGRGGRRGGTLRADAVVAHQVVTLHEMCALEVGCSNTFTCNLHAATRRCVLEQASADL